MPSNLLKLRGKRADIGFNTLKFLFFNFSFLFIVAITMFILIKGQVNAKVDVSQAEAEIFIQRLLYSRNGISYYDSEMQRLFPGTIVLDTFNEDYFFQNIEPSVYYGDDNRFIGLKLELHELDGSIMKRKDAYGNELGDAIAFYNKPFFLEKEVLQKAGTGFTLGRGGITPLKRTYTVNVVDNGRTRQGKLEILLLMQNV